MTRLAPFRAEVALWRPRRAPNAPQPIPGVPPNRVLEVVLVPLDDRITRRRILALNAVLALAVAAVFTAISLAAASVIVVVVAGRSSGAGGWIAITALTAAGAVAGSLWTQPSVTRLATALISRAERGGGDDRPG